MTVRCVFITSSYLRTFFRATKFCSSTFFWAFSIWFERIFASISWSSGSLKRSMMFLIRSPANRRTRSSSPEREKRAHPGAPRPPAGRVVGPARLVPFGREHVEPAELDDPFPELDVDAAAGHVRGDRDR